MTREAEIAKYTKAYNLESYHMGGDRMKYAKQDLLALPAREGYIDVGCGRGEMLDYALEIGFLHARGTEVVQGLLKDGIQYGEVHALPFPNKCCDVASSFDVIEHVEPGDDENLCRELQRIARKHILITANNAPSVLPTGEELHINRRPYAEWNELFRKWFTGRLTWIQTDTPHVTERWRVDL